MIDIDWNKFENPNTYPDYQTEEMCVKAVNQYGFTLKYVKDQTEDICLEAVKQNGLALRFVNIQTEEICFEAIKQDAYALKYIENKTEDTCIEALKTTWKKEIYDAINIPIGGKLPKEINNMKLLYGPLKLL